MLKKMSRAVSNEVHSRMIEEDLRPVTMITPPCPNGTSRHASQLTRPPAFMPYQILKGATSVTARVCQAMRMA